VTFGGVTLGEKYVAGTLLVFGHSVARGLESLMIREQLHSNPNITVIKPTRNLNKREFCVLTMQEYLAELYYHLIDLGTINTETWSHPFLAPTTHSCPVIITQFCAAFLIRTGNLPR